MTSLVSSLVSVQAALQMGTVAIDTLSLRSHSLIHGIASEAIKDRKSRCYLYENITAPERACQPIHPTPPSQ